MTRARAIGRRWPFPPRSTILYGGAGLLLAGAATLLLVLWKPAPATDGPVDPGRAPRTRTGPLFHLDDLRPVGIGRPGVELKDGPGRLRRARVAVVARVEGSLVITEAEHSFINPLGRAVAVRFAPALPEGARLVSAGVRVEGGVEADFGQELQAPPGTPVLVRIVHEQHLGEKLGRPLHAYSLPQVPLDEFSYTLSVDKSLAEDATFIPKEAERTEEGGKVTWRVHHKNVRPSGWIVFLGRAGK
jgi:hypothetical protein